MSAADADKGESNHARSSGEKRLGKYRILNRLGRGGMGVVYAAEDTLLKRPVAIKVLSSAVAKNPESLKRFLREAQAAARLIHPHVVAIHEIDQRDGLWFIVMEMIDGGSLQDYLHGRSSLAWPEATRLLADACQGLIAAHRVGLIHRDIKPANLMRTVEGRVKLVDFGLAKAACETSELTATGTVIGTPNFMSPEQWRAEPLDDLSDIYSLGATYFALLTGQAPYAGRDPLQVMYACCSEPPPDPSRCGVDIPAACVAVIQRAMAKEPMDRYANAQQMLADLLDVLGEDAPAHSSSAGTNAVSRTHNSAAVPFDFSAITAGDAATTAATRDRLRGTISLWNSRRTKLLLVATSIVASLLLVAVVVSSAIAPSGSRQTVAESPAKPPADDWVSLFNGRDLNGWWTVRNPPGDWIVENGMLIGRINDGNSNSSSYLFSSRNNYANFHCRAEVRIDARGNSGIFFRADSNASLPQGLEAQIGVTDMGDLHRTWAHSEQPLTVRESNIAVRPGDWVTLEIRAEGSHIIVMVDGRVTEEITEHPDAPNHGHLAVQVYGPETEVAIRKLEIRELP